MNLDALAGAAAVAAPSPLSSVELATAQGQVGAGEEPVPMAIEQLVSTSSAAAPGPEQLGALTAVGGPPEPQTLEQLGAVGEGGPPPPLDPDELTAAAKPATTRSTRQKRDSAAES